MTGGSACWRLLKSEQHVAWLLLEIESLVEAYGYPDASGDCAACHTDLDFNTIQMYYQHSIRQNPKFCDLFQARLNAFNLRTQVLRDCQQVHSMYAMTPRSRSVGCRQVPCTKPSVRFDFCISVAIATSDDDTPQTFLIDHSVLQAGFPKGWSLRPCSKSLKRFEAWQKYSDTGRGYEQFASQGSPCAYEVWPQVSAPLSTAAVSSFPVGSKVEGFQFRQPTDGDEVLLMQGVRSLPVMAKNDPHADMQGPLPTVAQGHAGPATGEDPVEGNGDNNVPSDTSSGGPTSESSDVDAGDEVVRQEVVMYHLDDLPIYAFVNWQSYEAMVTEIAHHYSVDRQVLVDVYEVVAPLPELRSDVVPIIVHLQDDIPPAFDVKLILLDLEFHGHQVEAHFHLGPMRSRQVVLVPTLVERSNFLRAAEVDRHCAFEQGRCLVFHNGQRWPDYDVHARRMTHGDFCKVAIPPSEDFACPTIQMVHMRQSGMSEAEIIDAIHNDDPVSGYSPSPLDETELRQLATPNLVESEDPFALLQVDSFLVEPSSRTVLGDITNFGCKSDPHSEVGDQVVLSDRQDSGCSAQQKLQCSACPQPTSLSFTDEFLSAIRAANEAVEDAPEFPDDEPPLAEQSTFVQELWELWSAHAVLGPGAVEPLGKIETWFTDHHRHLRCLASRVVVLPREYTTWERLILREWQEVVRQGVEQTFHLVFPLPEDHAAGVFAQVIVVQEPVELTKSLVLSIYDSERSFQRPKSFCQVLPARLGVDEVLEASGLSEVCGRTMPQNECSLWYGSTPIRPDQKVFARSGFALRLSVRRGIAIHLEQLLQMPDNALRAQLQSATWGVVYRRPTWPAFTGDAWAMPESSHWHRAEPMDLDEAQPNSVDFAQSSDDLPAWLVTLRSVFDSKARIDDPEEGLFIEVLVWFLHGQFAESCLAPRIARLDSTQFMWRSTLVFPWLDNLQRAQPLDFHFVHPAPPQEPWSTVAAHVIISQQLAPDQRAVLLCDMSTLSPHGCLQRAFLMPRRVSTMDIRSAMPRSGAASVPQTVSQGDFVFSDDQSVRLSHGDCLVLKPIPEPSSASPYADPLPDLDENDGNALLQLPRVHMQVPKDMSQSRQGDAFPAQGSLKSHSLDAPRVAGDPNARVVLSLDACIAAPRPFQDDNFHGPELTYCSRSDWPAFIGASQVHFEALPEGLNITAHTYFALQSPELHLEPEFANSTVLYVDGSAQAQFAAWSVIAIQYDDCGTPRLQGCLAGPVILAQEKGEWIGAVSADNISAELSAVSAALVVALCGDQHSRVVIRPDLQLSAMLTTLQWQCAAHPCLSRLCQLLGTWFHKIQGTFVEVRGHTQHPWNDLADAVASFSRRTHAVVGRVSWEPFHELIVTNDANWAWLFDAKEALHYCLPPGSQQGCWQITPSLRKVAFEPPAAGTDQWTSLQFSVASANVLALSDTIDGLPDATPSERVVRLDRQWHGQRIAAVGIQESRRAAGKFHTDHYVGFASGAQVCGKAHHFGCELWLHKSISLDPDHKLVLADFKATVACADPRRLIVNLAHPGICISFVVLHVPCQSASFTQTQLAAWWQDTIDIVQHASLSKLVWCMIDANAPLASHCSEFFQMHGAEKTNAQGKLFESALASLHWYVPSTMDWAHVGSHETWTHPRGCKFRRDFVACSADAFALSSRSWVDTHFDGGFGHDDHFPVLLSCQGWIQCSRKNQKFQWDRLAFLDPEKQRLFQEAVRTLPIPDWSVHVDQHADIFQHNLLKLAQQHFQKTSKNRLRPRLSEMTRSLIQFKRSCLDFGRAQQLMHDVPFKHALKQVEKDVRRSVRHDQRLFYESLVQELGKAGELHDARHMYKLLTQLGGRKNAKSTGTTLPLLKQNGVPVTTFHEQQRVWMRQFADVEAGNIIARSEFQRLLPACLGLEPSVPSIEVFPHVFEVVDHIHRMKRGKAPGPDGIPPDVLKAGSHAVAKHLTVLMTKVASHGREPAAWRTGKLVPLHKGKLAKSDPAGYRSIFLNNFSTKVYHSVLRKHLVQAWTSVLTHLQLGGRKGMGCDTANHLVQSHVAFCQVRKVPGAVLFVDFKCAFYTVLRQGLFNQPFDDTAFLVAMHRLGVHPDDIQKLLRHAHSENAIRNISPHAVALLQDVLKATCFEIEGLDEVAATTRGTRPGDPIGDIAFNIMMAALLKDVTERMTITGAHWEGTADPVTDFAAVHALPAHFWAEVAYVDDLAVMLHSPCNASLVSFAQVATRAVLDAAHLRGLELTIGSGKTEILWALHGAGKKTILAEVASKQGLGVEDSDGSQPPVTVPVVQSYKHLGTWIQHDAKPLRAIRSRVVAARQAWGPLVKPFLSKRGVLLRTKVQVFESLVLSRFLFNAHTWCLLLPAHLDEWAAGLRPMLFALAKPLLRGLAPFSFDVEVLCGICKLLPPKDLLHLSRLRYFKRLLTNCPALLWKLTKGADHGEGSWLHLLQSSFGWLCHFSDARFGLSAETSLEDWCSFVAVDGRWKGRLKRAMEACRSYHHECAKQTVWQKWFGGNLMRFGVDLGEVKPAAPLPQWQCLQCNLHFHSKRALALHATKKHDYKTLVKHFALDGTCPNCCRIFHTRIRLCCHLRTAVQCLDRLRAAFPPLSGEVMEQLDALDREHARMMHVQGWLPTKAQVPAMRAFGPSLPPSGSLDAAHMRAKWVAREGLHSSPAFEALQGICDNPSMQPDGSVHDQEMNDAQSKQMSFVMHSARGSEHGHGGCFSMAGLARLYAKLHVRTMCFIHVFSGFRRKGDLQHQIEQHWVQGIHHIFCVSIDFCLQGQEGDLSSAKNVEFWKGQICSGAVLGMGGGPPCETFSAARYLEGGATPPCDPLMSHAGYLLIHRNNGHRLPLALSFFDLCWR